MNTQAVEVIQDDEEIIPVEIMADAIVKISEGMGKLLAGRLKRRTIVLLLRDQTGLGMREINLVLDALRDLSEEYVRP